MTKCPPIRRGQGHITHSRIPHSLNSFGMVETSVVKMCMLQAISSVSLNWTTDHP